MISSKYHLNNLGSLLWFFQTIHKKKHKWLILSFWRFCLKWPPLKNATKFPEKCSVSFLKTRWMQGRRGRHQHRPPPALPGILCPGNQEYLQRNLCDPHWERHLGVEMVGDCDKGVEGEGGDLAVGGWVTIRRWATCICVSGLVVVLANLTSSAPAHLPIINSSNRLIF